MSSQYFLFPGEIWERLFSIAGAKAAGHVCIATSTLRNIYLPSDTKSELCDTASRVWKHAETCLKITNVSPRLVVNSLQLVKNYFLAYKNLESGRALTELLVEDKVAPSAVVDRYFHNTWIYQAPTQRFVYIQDPVMSSHEPDFSLGFVDFHESGWCRDETSGPKQDKWYMLAGGYLLNSKPIGTWHPGIQSTRLSFHTPGAELCQIHAPVTPPGFVDDAGKPFWLSANQHNDFPQLLLLRTAGSLLSFA